METTSRSGKVRLLLMDDEEGVRAIAGRILEGMGYAVDYAIEGNEAVDLFVRAIDQGVRYAVVILDLNVPGGMGGVATLAKIREIDPAVKSFACSGYEDDPVMLDYTAHGFSGAIAKPFRYEEMVAALKQVFDDATPREDPPAG